MRSPVRSRSRRPSRATTGCVHAAALATPAWVRALPTPPPRSSRPRHHQLWPPPSPVHRPAGLCCVPSWPRSAPPYARGSATAGAPRLAAATRGWAWGRRGAGPGPRDACARGRASLQDLLRSGIRGDDADNLKTLLFQLCFRNHPQQSFFVSEDPEPRTATS
eukprot:SAG25_NODE_278_length_10480_cov_29.988537_4_plen_163_part_00